MGLIALVAAAGLGSPSQLAAQDDRGLAVIEGAAERYAAVDALCAEFRQHLLVPLLGDERTGTGRLCQARPNRFAMRFSDPEGDAIVIDGESVWIYYPSLDPKQVVKVPMSDRPGGHDFHREFLEDPDSKYHVTYEAVEDVAGATTHRLRLVPKQPVSYRAAVLWIDQGAPVLRQIRVEEENGTVRTITLGSVEFDATPGPDWFTFTPPEGALVISG
jgi:outer membrane lipoprotein-sorting protein